MVPGKIIEAVTPYGTSIKAGLAVAALAALGALAWSWDSRGKEIDRLTSWQDSVVIAVTTAVVEPDERGRRVALTPEGALAGIATLSTSLDDALDSLRVISWEAQNAKARAEQADARLADALASFNRRYAAATRRINDLESRQPAATPAEAIIVIENDSKAPWEGWR